MNASPTGRMLGPPAFDGDSFAKVTRAVGYTTPNAEFTKMIKPTFQTWAIKNLFVLALEGGKQPNDMTRLTFVWQRALLIWFRLYGRITFMTGDWAKSIMFESTGMF